MWGWHDIALFGCADVGISWLVLGWVSILILWVGSVVLGWGCLLFSGFVVLRLVF